MLAAGARMDGAGIVRIRPRLLKLVGEGDANAMLTGLHGGGGALASLGPVLGLGELARGDIDAAEYLRRWGHRCPDEFEISVPRPAEEPGWVDRQLAAIRDGGTDPETLLARQEQARDEAWRRFREHYPRKAADMRSRVDRSAVAARSREAARSEVIRAFWVLRAFVLRAGVLSGHGDDLFFLSADEVLAVLGGDESAIVRVPPRREAYRRYSSLPAYPTLIRGRFDPARWAADPDRRGDIYDATADRAPVSDAITGFSGAAGVVDGIARVITSSADAESLRPGEILVTTVTNIGWTPLFPRAAAVVTDVGAPLSHAAIVARELGIPAVVGTGNATARLHTGDRIRVDGERGVVELLAG
jgi:pyruvate,water dikinase